MRSRATTPTSAPGTSRGTGEQYLIRAPGQVATLDDIRQIVVGTHAGVPVYVRDVADVIVGEELRTGAATRNGEEVVLGTVFMLMGENSRSVAERVHARMQEINRTLPDGVERDHRLQSHDARRSDDRDGTEESPRGRAAGRGHPVRAARQLPSRARDRAA